MKTFSINKIYSVLCALVMAFALTAMPVYAATSISSAEVSGVEYETNYTGKAITFPLTVKVGDTTLVEGTDYTVTYADNTEVGSASISIKGMGNYEGEQLVVFNIVKDSDSEDVEDEDPEEDATEEEDEDETEEDVDDEEEESSSGSSATTTDSTKGANATNNASSTNTASGSNTTTVDNSDSQLTNRQPAGEATGSAAAKVEKETSPKTADTKSALPFAVAIFYGAIVVVAGGAYVTMKVKNR